MNKEKIERNGLSLSLSEWRYREKANTVHPADSLRIGRPSELNAFVCEKQFRWGKSLEKGKYDLEFGTLFSPKNRPVNLVIAWEKVLSVKMFVKSIWKGREISYFSSSKFEIFSIFFESFFFLSLKAPGTLRISTNPRCMKLRLLRAAFTAEAGSSVCTNSAIIRMREMCRANSPLPITTAEGEAEAVLVN